MRNKFFILLFVFVIGFSFASPAFASFLGFGGRIISVPATEIIAAQSAGYICPQAMLTFTIMPVSKSPTSFVILNPITGFTIAPNKNTLGLYGTTIPISCIHSSILGGAMIVPLTPVFLYGTSQY